MPMSKASKYSKQKLIKSYKNQQIQSNNGRFGSHLCNDRKSRLERKWNAVLKAWLTHLTSETHFTYFATIKSTCRIQENWLTSHKISPNNNKKKAIHNTYYNITNKLLWTVWGKEENWKKNGSNAIACTFLVLTFLPLFIYFLFQISEKGLQSK